MAVTQADSTVNAIERLVRELTNSPGQSALTTSYIQQTINDIYQTDFAYGIKIDQMRSVYTIYTQPYIDRYPLDVNFNQGVRSPVYVDGLKGGLFKDRSQFYSLWPKLLSQYQPVSGDGATLTFTFTIQGPFLRNEVIIGWSDESAGAPITIKDDGEGNLWIIEQNPQASVPDQYPTPVPVGLPTPGMPNMNLNSPGQYKPVFNVGSVNYVSGAFSLDFTGSGYIPESGETATVRVSQYQPNRPYSILFFNNEFIVRPVPEKIHKIEFETYLTPVQFMATTDHPILNQWWKYLGYLVSVEIQRRRNDFDGASALMEGAKRQESLVLERQGIEEIGQTTPTMFNAPNTYPYGNNYLGTGYW